MPLPLDLVEMGLPKGLKARVLENLPCPPIRPGPGRVVLTTVNHLNRYVFELRVEDESERETVFRPTGFHKFFSADRRKWISADSLREGERLTALGGTVRLLSRTRIPGTHRVYNLTVEGEHVYHVTNLVVDGHNTCPGGDAPKEAAGDLARRLGREGEDAAGIVQGAKQRIPSLTGTARYRVPDELTEVTLREIKNVARQSKTKQLIDFLEYARDNNLTFILETRANTRISGPLQDLIEQGLIVHQIIGQ